MAIDERQINAIVDAVVNRLQRPKPAAAVSPAAPARKPVSSHDYVPTYGKKSRRDTAGHGKKGVFEDMDSAVAAARVAHEALLETSLETRAKMIQAMRETTAQHVNEIAKRAVEETGLGNVPDKINKNLLVAWKTPGIEILRPVSWTGDHGLALLERAPFGVIGSITPTTNPTETILNNGIGMIAGGNSVVYNVHPSAKKTSRWFVELLNEAIVGVGGPENLLTCIAEPTIESAGQLMKHPGIRLIVVTGGPAVVKAAMNSGKRAICAGPGNPPAVVDETAHIDRAGRDIVTGASMDNNVICIVEKEVFAVASIADKLKASMVDAGAYEVTGAAIDRLQKLVVAEDGHHPAKDWVGKDATKIARAAGIHVPEKTRLLFAEVDAMHPFVQAELLLPVIGFVRVPDVDAAIEGALQAEHGFGHTATMHSTNIDNLSRMARAVNTSIFVKNGPSLAGLGFTGEGYTSFTIASPTGEGLTTALSFTRERRCTLKDSFRIV
ncbi:MAG TPA: aldehyde dehydrogenase family protein [Myxococcales bacterium]|jgi:acyl-CoA reductase-like NAD-dependent aldehyde dehydrogenase